MQKYTDDYDCILFIFVQIIYLNKVIELEYDTSHFVQI